MTSTASYPEALLDRVLQEAIPQKPTDLKHGRTVQRRSHNQHAPKILSITWDGLQRLEAETVRTFSGLRPGQPYDLDTIDRALVSLFDTELFADVSVQNIGGNLIFRVRENPIVNRVTFEGNRQVGDAELSQCVTLAPRQIFTLSRADVTKSKILRLYSDRGYPSVSVEARLLRLVHNRVDVAFVVDENSIEEHLDSVQSTLETTANEVAIKHGHIFRLFHFDSVDGEGALDRHRQKLRAFYLNDPPADLRIVKALAKDKGDGRDYYLSYVVDETSSRLGQSHEQQNEAGGLRIDSSYSSLERFMRSIAEGNSTSNELQKPIPEVLRKIIKNHVDGRTTTTDNKETNAETQGNVFVFDFIGNKHRIEVETFQSKVARALEPLFAELAMPEPERADYALKVANELQSFGHARQEVSRTQHMPESAPEIYAGLRGPETPPEFVKRVYGEWLGQGLTRAHIRQFDPTLYQAIVNWTRKSENEWPADVDLPTLKEQNTRWADHVGKDGIMSAVDGLSGQEAVREARRLANLRHRRSKEQQQR